ncbi:MAG TPA: aminotransferase class V-fold PLP-dependent enzyme [Planctomycetota bacterium]|nr:aminotransferase class V-fold PLP-dependent enzyme [Planctomycetota bacterium]
MTRIYLDNHATTPVDPRVLEGMIPYFCETFGNAASVTHGFGREAARAVEDARSEVAQLINAQPEEIVFTSGATEADNLALKGVLEPYRAKGQHLVTVATEHKAVLDTCKSLVRSKLATASYLPVSRDGLVDLNQLRDAIRPETILVSVMHSNNEIGVIQPLAEIARICHEKGVVLHTDATQSAGKVPFDVKALDVDLASLSAHKMYGPKGVGCLYVRRRRPRPRLAALISGGGHEGGLRSGTLPVPLIVGFGLASRFASKELTAEATRVGKLRDRLREGLFHSVEGVHLNGHATERLPGNLNLSFEGVESDSLINALGDIALSSSSACSSATVEPSHVLRAMGVRDSLIYNAVRFGLGRFTTSEEIEEVLARIPEAIGRLRRLQQAESK